MSVRRIAPLAAVVLIVLAPPAALAEPAGADYGGCRQGGPMTGRLIPGTGSAGQSIQREGTLSDCVSSLLPGIDAARFTVTLPWSAPGAPSAARFSWSDGSLSTATGYGNGLWLFVTGPATGHAIQLNTADTWSGWYLSYAEVTVTSAGFVS